MQRIGIFFTLLACAASAPAQEFPEPVDLFSQIDLIGSGMEIQAITVDGGGNVYVAGVSSRGFPGATSTIGPLGKTDLFVIKLDAAVSQVLYAASIGGSEDETLKAIRADATGNIYLIGSTTSSNFPSTKVFNANNPIGAVVAKLNPAGSALAYGTVLGPRMTALALDVDSNGAAFVTGIANSQDLPSTPGVLRPSPAEDVGLNVYLGFVEKVNPAGDQIELATYYGADSEWVEAISILPSGNVVILGGGQLAVLDSTLSAELSAREAGIKPGSLAFDGSGNIYVSGTSLAASGGFALKKFSSDGQQVLLDMTLPLATGADPARVAVTSSGRIYAFGVPTTAGFPTLNATQPCLANIAPPGGSAGATGPDSSGGLIGSSGSAGQGDRALMILGPDGAVLHATFFSTAVGRAAVSPSSGRIYAAGKQTVWGDPNTTWNGLFRIDPNLIPAARVAPSCAVHAATFSSVPLSPGAIMTLFGSNLGPAEPASFALGEDGKVPPELAGVGITVGGQPAIMLFAIDRQLNFIVPWETPDDGSVVPLCVTYGGETSCISAATTRAVPAAFQDFTQPGDENGIHHAAALNQDGTVNSPSNPAPRGTVVQTFLTGTGRLDGEVVDGGVGAAPLASVPGDQTARYSSNAEGCTLFGCPNAPGSGEVKVQYAGEAPNLVLGVTQLNLFIPRDMPVGPNQLFIVEFHLPGAQDPVIALIRLSVGE